MINKQTITRVGLIRHAQTLWNAQKRIQGWSDIPLSDAGKQQALAWGPVLAGFGWDQILVSTLARAVETGDILTQFLQVPVIKDARLKEQNWGLWCGMSMAQIKMQAPELFAKQINAGWEFCPPDGESRNTVFQRSMAAIEDAVGRLCGRTVLVIAHEGLIKCLYYRLQQQCFKCMEPTLMKPHHLHWLIFADSELQTIEPNAIRLTGIR